MQIEPLAMAGAGILAVIAGLFLVRKRFAGASGVNRLLLLGAVFEAASLAVFAAEHFTAARELAPIVPRWLPYPLFWTYFVGVALLAAAVSFVSWKCVRWSAPLLALFFLIIVATVDLPNLPANLHDRFFWILIVRESSFAGGAMALTAVMWSEVTTKARWLGAIGRSIVAGVMIFYGIQHLLFPRFVPGVPLQKLMPASVPAPTLLAYGIGLVLLAGGAGLLIPRLTPLAAAVSGAVLVVLTGLFYVPIAVAEFHSPLAVEGLNYVFDTLLFSATVLLAGLPPQAPEPAESAFPARGDTRPVAATLR